VITLYAVAISPGFWHVAVEIAEKMSMRVWAAERSMTTSMNLVKLLAPCD